MNLHFTPTRPPAAREPRLRQAALACVVFYFFSGFSTISWMSRMPSIRDALNVTASDIGLIFLLGSVGSLIALPTAGPLVGAFGARWGLRIGLSVWTTGMLGAAGALSFHSTSLFAVSLIGVFGGLSLWGSSMNIEGGLVEVAMRKIILPQLHASYSVGAVLGAFLSAPIAAAEIPVAWHVMVLALPVWMVTMLAAVYVLSEGEVVAFTSVTVSADVPDPHPISAQQTSPALTSVRERTKKAWTEKRTIMIAILAMSSGLLEGSANDWLALAMVDGYGQSESAASLIFALFLLTIVAIRLVAPRLVTRYGQSALLRVLMSVGVMGIVFVAFASALPFALMGVAFWAVGAALIFPACGSALSYEPDMTAARMSVMTSIEYVSYLAAPPLIGLMAENVGYHRALILVVPVVCVGVYLTRFLPIPVGRHGVLNGSVSAS